MKPQIRNRLKLAIYVQIALQTFVPIQMSWASSPVALPKPDVINTNNTKIETARNEAELISLNYFKRGYTIHADETLAEIAKYARISPLTLREINRIHIPDDKSYYALKSGDYVMIPDWEHPINETASPAIIPAEPAAESSADKPAADNHSRLDAALTGLGGALQSRDQGAAARGLAVNTATGAATQSVKQWMEQYGNARVTFSVDDRLQYNGASADLLVPLNDNDSNDVIFTQVGITDKEHYTTANLGAGQRLFFDSYMLGYNAFLDQELRNQHTRLGAGIEYWRDYLKVAANVYAGVSGWKESKQLEDYEERPASGFDLRADAWLPAYPQLGGRLRFEQYFGDQVGLISASDRQSDPTAVTLGVNYTPVSLITAGVDQRFSSGKSDTQFNLQFNYQLGTPLNQQLDPEHVKDRRTLIGSRLDFVDRNNAMVMEYRKMEVIKLSLPPVLKGEASQTHTINSVVKTRHGLKKVEWDTSALLAAGARVTATKDHTLTLALPSAPGSYPLSAVAWDTKGNASNTASMTIEVDKNNALPGHQISHLQANPLQQKANGVDVITYTLRALGPDGKPAKNARVQWNADRGDIQQPETVTNDAGEATTTVLSRDTGKVNLSAVLLDEQGNKLTDRVHKDAEFINASHVLTLTADKATAKPDGNDVVTFTYTLKDTASQPVPNQAIEWRNVDSLGSMTPVSTSTDQQGVAKATLTSTSVGTTKLAVTIKNADGSTGEDIVSQPVAFAFNAVTTLTEDKTQAISDGIDVVTLDYLALDDAGKPIANTDIQWSLDPALGNLTPASSKTDSAGKARATLSSTTNGRTTVHTTLHDSAGNLIASAESQEITFATTSALSLQADKTGAKANGTDTITLTFKALDNTNKPLANREIDWSNAGVGTLTPVTTRTNAQGEATATIVSNVIGQTQIGVTLKNADGSAHASASSSSLNFQLGTIATLDADKNSALADGVEVITFTYHLEDELGNPLANENITWSMSPSLGTLTPVSKTDSNGDAKATLISNAAGNTTLTVTLDKDGKTQSSPVVNFVKNAQLTLTADKSSAKADGNEAITFTYRATDQSGNPLKNRLVDWDNVQNLGFLRSSDNATDNNGEAKAVLVSVAEGKTQLGVTLKNADGSAHQRTQSGEVEFVLGTLHSVNPDKSSALADGYEAITLTYQAMNELSQPIANANISWESEAGFGDLKNAVLKTDQNGKATATLLSNQTGTTKVIVTLTDKNLQATSSVVTFDQNATIVLTPSKNSAQADGSDTITFTYMVTDRVGNPLASRDLTWTNTSIGDMRPDSIVTDAQGKATAKLTSTVAGSTTLQVALKRADGTVFDTVVSDPVSFSTVVAPVVTLTSDHDQSWALASHQRVLSMRVTQSGTPLASKPLQWDLSGCQTCTVSDPQPVTDGTGNATVQFHSTAAGSKALKVCLKDEPGICSSDVSIQVLDLPAVEHRAKGASSWLSGNWNNKPLLKSGVIELQVNGGSNDIAWQAGPGISINGSGSTVDATLDSPTGSMTIDYTVHSSEPKMALTQQMTLSGTTLFMPGASPAKMLYQEAIDTCSTLGASQVSESTAKNTFDVWGSTRSIGNYGNFFEPWLIGSRGFDPNYPDNAKALDMEAGTVTTAFNSYTSRTHALCEK